MNDEEEKILVVAGIGVAAYFLVVRPLLADVGIDPAVTANINAVATAPPDSNAWSPQFQPFIDQYQGNWSNSDEASYMQAIYGNIHQSFFPVPTDPLTQLAVKAESIYNSFSYLTSVDTQNVIAVFKTLDYQTDVSFIAAYLNYNYGVDLINFLQQGKRLFSFVPHGMSNADLNTVINFIKNLPVSP